MTNQLTVITDGGTDIVSLFKSGGVEIDPILARIKAEKAKAAQDAVEAAQVRAKAEVDRVAKAAADREAQLQRDLDAAKVREEQAAQKERDRIAAEQKAKDEAESKRAAGLAHVAKIKADILDALRQYQDHDDIPGDVASALMNGKIPHCKVSI